MIRLYLHVGTHKTGTKTIQHCLYNHSEELSGSGIYLPAREDIDSTKIWRSQNWMAQALTGRYAYTKAEVVNSLQVAAAQCPADGCVIFSAEDLSACCPDHMLWEGLDRADFRELQQDFLGKLAELLQGLGFEVIPVIVLRRADEFIQSLYQTVIKGDFYRGNFEEFCQYAQPLLDYQGQVDAFRTAFGSLRVLSFHDLTPEFAPAFFSRIGIDFQPQVVPTRNQSVDARLTYWTWWCHRLGSTEPAEVIERKVFCFSEYASKLFDDYGQASFWTGVEKRNEFHDRVAGQLEGVSFPPPRHKAAVDARLGEDELARISLAFSNWKSSRQKNR